MKAFWKRHAQPLVIRGALSAEGKVAMEELMKMYGKPQGAPLIPLVPMAFKSLPPMAPLLSTFSPPLTITMPPTPMYYDVDPGDDEDK